jgi:hypothetical protein
MMDMCWPQIKLLRVLGMMGANDRAASENMYAVVADAMRRGNVGNTIGNAIVYECVRTITAIFPNPSLLQSGMPAHLLGASGRNCAMPGSPFGPVQWPCWR